MDKQSKFTDDDCWNYLGPFHISRHGIPYGRYGGTGAHRVSYETFKGPIPKGLTIDHLCRNTVCINPNHLEAVTLKENILRGDSPTARHRRSTHCPKGHSYDRTGQGVQVRDVREDDSRAGGFKYECRGNRMTFDDEDLKRLKEKLENNSVGQRIMLEGYDIRNLLARLEAAEKGCAVLDDIHYCFQNIWGLDRKAFENKFMAKMKEALEAWRKAAGK